MFKYYRVIRIIEVKRGDRYITRNELREEHTCVYMVWYICIYIHIYTKENGRDFKTYIRDVSNATVEGILYV